MIDFFYFPYLVPPKIQIDPPLQTVRPGDTAIINCVAVLIDDINNNNNNDDLYDNNYYYDNDNDDNNNDHNHHNYNHQSMMAQITWSRIDSELPTGIVVTENDVHHHHNDDIMNDGIRSMKTITSRLIFYGIEYTDAGKYLCTAVNGAGRVEAMAELIVVDKHDAQNVREEFAILGANLLLRCPTEFVESNEDLYIEWEFDYNYQLKQNLSDTNNNNNQYLSKQFLPDNVKIIHNLLNIHSVQMNNIGRYFCHVIWNGSLVEQNAIILNIKQPKYHNCDSNQFMCTTNGECIDILLRCNGLFDCIDQSDEDSCVRKLDFKSFLVNFAL